MKPSSLCHAYSIKACALVLVLGSLSRGFADGPSAARPYATLLGGSGDDRARALVRDPDGFVYVAGLTDSLDFPAIEDEVQATDVIVVRLTPELDEIDRVVTLGGPGRDEAISIDISPAGRIIVTGIASAGFPTTDGAFQTENAGGLDLFVVALDEELELVYSTLVGGQANEEIYGADVSDDGIVSIVGYTMSSHTLQRPFPVTSNAFQPAYGGGGSDTVLARVRPDETLPPLEQLVYATFLGGSSHDWESGGTFSHDVTTTPSGLVLVAGHTASTNFPVTAETAIQPSYGGGTFDVFLAVLDTARGPEEQLVYSTFLGGGADDGPREVVWLGEERVAMTGWTWSTNFPRTDRSAFGGRNDGWITILDLSKQGAEQLELSTLFGGESVDTPYFMAATPAGDLLICGRTVSGSFPSTNAACPFQAGIHQGFFLVYRPDPSLSPDERVLLSTSVGGGTFSSDDYALDIEQGTEGTILLCGLTGSLSFPTTDGAVQPDFAGGGRDMFLTMLDVRVPEAAIQATPETGPAPLDVTLDAASSSTPPGTLLTRFEWDLGDGETVDGESVQYTFPIGRHVVSLRVENDLELVSTKSVEIPAFLETVDADGWVGADIGEPRYPGGSAPLSGSTPADVQLCGGGNNPFTEPVEYHHRFQAVSGDFRLTARVSEATGLAIGSRAGLVVRGEEDPRLAFGVYLYQVRSDGTVRLESRAFTDRSDTERGPDMPAFEGWLRLERRDGTLTSWFSSDGADWTLLHEIPADALPQLLLAGPFAAKPDRRPAPSAFEPLCVRVSDLDLTIGTAPEATFLRGDCNDDGTIDISDGVCILNWLFLGGATPGCDAVTDTNGDRQPDISDATYLLNHLFLGGPALAAPFPECGPSTESCETPSDACS